jgi:hypothetical protein
VGEEEAYGVESSKQLLSGARSVGVLLVERGEQGAEGLPDLLDVCYFKVTVDATR